MRLHIYKAAISVVSQLKRSRSGDNHRIYTGKKPLITSPADIASCLYVPAAAPKHVHPQVGILESHTFTKLNDAMLCFFQIMGTFLS